MACGLCYGQEIGPGSGRMFWLLYASARHMRALALAEVGFSMYLLRQLWRDA